MIADAERLALLASLGPDQRLVAAYTPSAMRNGVIALLAFDRTLGEAVRRASEPITGQLRLAWWRDYLDRSDVEPGRDPLAGAIADMARQAPVRADLIAMVNGWESLFEPLPLRDPSLLNYARGRGHGLYSAIARFHGRASADRAGEASALIDLAFHCSDPETADRALALAAAMPITDGLPRPLAILDRFARRDAGRGLAKGTAEGTPSRLWDALAVRLSAS